MKFDTIQESRYQKYHLERSKAVLHYGILMGVFANLIFVILDYYAFPTSFKAVLAIRFCLVIPSFFGILLTLKHSIYDKVYKYIHSGVMLVNGLSVLGMICISEPTEIGHNYYYLILMLIVMAMSIPYLYLIDYRTVMINTTLILFFYELTAVFKQNMLAENQLLFVSNNFFLISGCILSIIASYQNELSTRKEFLIIREKDDALSNVGAQNKEIEQKNQQIKQQHKELLQNNEIGQNFEALVDQLNPHFLFNSLNTLSSLVVVDSDKSVRFIERFSDIYRYILEFRKEKLVPLTKELEFVRAYFYMQQIRFGGNVKLIIDITGCKNTCLPPFTLQLLVENAIKHNEISRFQQLTINIYNESGNEFLLVKNKIVKIHKPEPSSGIGLKNLFDRYRLMDYQIPEVYTEDGFFIVKIPLINEQY